MADMVGDMMAVNAGINITTFFQEREYFDRRARPVLRGDRLELR
jgi:hypothetical protein